MQLNRNPDKIVCVKHPVMQLNTCAAYSGEVSHLINNKFTLSVLQFCLYRAILIKETKRL